MHKKIVCVAESISYSKHAYHHGLAQGRKVGFTEGWEEGATTAYTALADEFHRTFGPHESPPHSGAITILRLSCRGERKGDRHQNFVVSLFKGTLQVA
jgi:hypothetical protein